MNKNRIKYFREQKKLTQKQFADSFNKFLKNKNIKPLSSATLARWERGDNTPNKKYLELLSQYLNVPEKYIKGAFYSSELLTIIKSVYDKQIQIQPHSVQWYKDNRELAYYCDLFLYIVGGFLRPYSLFLFGKPSAFSIDENSELISPDIHDQHIIGNLESATIDEWDYFFGSLFTEKYSIYLELLINGNIEFRQDWLVNSFIQALKVAILDYINRFGADRMNERENIEHEYNEFFNYNDDLPF